MASLMPQGKQQYFDSNGDPLSGGKVYTYAAGTTTPLDTYTTEAAGTPNANPVVLDSRGEASIFWGTGGYKVVLKTSADATVWTQDNLYAAASSLRTATGAVSVAAATAPSTGQVLTATSSSVATWQTPSTASSTTEALETTTTDVDVSASAAPSAGQVLTATGSTAATWQNPMTGFYNRIINGDMTIAQRVQQASTTVAFTSATLPWANGDDSYTLDRWYLLTDGADIVDVTQDSTNVPTGNEFAITLDVETVNKKFGIAQIIERANITDLIGQTVTVSFKAKVSATTKLDNVKCGIVAWTGTADSVTSDIVSAWNVEGTNPTLIANAAFQNTPANLSVTTTWATYSVSAAVSASAKNIIVFIWSDVTDTTLGDFLHITDVQLGLGSTVMPFARRSRQQELVLCQRYFERIGMNDGVSNLAVRVMMNNDIEVHTFGSNISYRVTKRIYPTVTLYGFGGVTSGQVEKVVSGAAGTNVSATANPYTRDGFSPYIVAAYVGFINVYSPSNADAEL